MSFKLFAYYCAVCGAWAAFFGWMLGTWFLAPAPKKTENTAISSEAAGSASTSEAWSVGKKGLALGLMVALGLSLLDSFWVFGLNRIGPVLLRVGAALLVGLIGGFIGGWLGQRLFEWTNWALFVVIGWTMTGALIGASIGTFDILMSVIKKQDVINSKRKLLKCLLGGTIGGLLGGIVFTATMYYFGSKAQYWWTPSAFGFVVLGACIGLLVSLAQIILKEAWIKVEAGFRPGREMILAKESTSVGRAESADIALFGDAGVERSHAHIVQKNGQYVLEDANTPGGTYINDVKVHGTAILRSGDLIRLGGKSLLRFYERPKKAASK